MSSKIFTLLQCSSLRLHLTWLTRTFDKVGYPLWLSSHQPLFLLSSSCLQSEGPSTQFLETLTRYLHIPYSLLISSCLIILSTVCMPSVLTVVTSLDLSLQLQNPISKWISNRYLNLTCPNWAPDISPIPALSVAFHISENGNSILLVVQGKKPCCYPWFFFFSSIPHPIHHHIMLVLLQKYTQNISCLIPSAATKLWAKSPLTAWTTSILHNNYLYYPGFSLFSIQQAEW